MIATAVSTTIPFDGPIARWKIPFDFPVNCSGSLAFKVLVVDIYSLDYAFGISFGMAVDLTGSFGLSC